MLEVLDMDFTTRLKKLRDELKLTQKELAEKVNLAQKTLSNYENGRREPDQETLIRIAKFFDVSIDYLLGYSDTKKPGLAFMTNSSNDDAVSESVFNYSPVYPVGSMIKIPVLKSININGPAFTADNIIDYVSLPSEDLPQGEYFGYQAKGDVMNLSHIDDGCVVIIRKQDYVEDGQIGLIIVDDQEPFINRIVNSDDQITLFPHSTNSIHLPKMLDLKKSNVRIIGRIVQSIIRY